MRRRSGVERRAFAPTQAAFAVGCALLGLATTARASEPAPSFEGQSSERTPSLQWDAGLVAGVCGTGDADGIWQSTRFCGGLRGDALFGRERASSVGYGPYASITTAGFDDARFGLGGSVLVPVLEDLPLVLSLGGMARLADGEARPGAETWLFWGARSFNFHGNYNLSNGLLVGAQTTFGSRPENALWVAAQVDAEWPLIPFILLVGLFQGS